MDFSIRQKYRPDYMVLAAELESLIRFETVLDIGSANGFLIDGLKNKSVTGVEIDESVKPYLSERAAKNTIFADITKIKDLGKFDLVTCVEVAEHIPEARSDALVKSIARSAKKHIYFTAATPFQGGSGHINCQPHFYWLSKFRGHDIHLNYDLTRQIINSLQKLSLCYWLRLNSLILTKND